MTTLLELTHAIQAQEKVIRQGGGEGQVTAFLFTPDMPGFRVVEARMEQLGIRG